MSQRPVLYLIDGHAVAYRQFYALKGSGFSNSKGEPTNATFGFTRILIELLQDIRPQYLAVSFDLGLGGRDEYFSDYKANRDAMPDELRPQIERIKQVVSAFNIPVLTLAEQEADDIIGTVAKQAEAQGADVHIITGDRDILQLLTDHVRVQLPQRKGPDKVFDIPAFQEKYSLHPNQLIDLKALMGDSSDNIPGVKGVGEKTATKLLSQYGTLENIYEHIDEIKGSVQTKLINDREMAFVSQRLATIMTDLPITLDLEACVTQDYDPIKVDEIFAEVEFNSLRERFRQSHDDVNFDPPFEFETVIVQTTPQLDELTQILNQASAIVWDVETTSVDQMSTDLVGIALSVDDKTGYYIPVGHIAEGAGTLFEEPVAEQLPITDVIEAIRPAMTNPDIPKYAHNATFDMVVLSCYGLDVTPVGFDTMLAEWVRDPISNNLSLKKFARNELKIHMTEIGELIGTGKKQRKMSEIAIDDVAPYAAADAVVTFRAQEELRKRLDDIGTLDLYTQLDLPLVPVIAQMEQAGTLLDVAFLQNMSEELASKISVLERDIYEQGGREFNINSPKQLNEILFTDLKLPVAGLKKTTHGYSTDSVTLDALKDTHPIIPLIIQHRELSKLKSTYVDALPQLVNITTGRVHTNYNQTGTSTGRFSSSNPNLQNIPIRTEIGREVRSAFIAPEGKVLLAVDYSQIELRVMAHISQDKTLIQAFRDGQDIHQATAAAVSGVAPDEVTYEQRSFAKRVNFGLMYGMGAFRLARDSDLDLAEAKKFIETYFERLPGVEKYLRETEKFALDNGYVQTLMGRKRYFPRLASGHGSGNRAQADLRAAINMPIQGTAADILKQAMLNLSAKLSDLTDGTQMILQVHDELVLEVPEDKLKSVAKLVTSTMESAFELDVPLVANAEYGQNWRDMQELEIDA